MQIILKKKFEDTKHVIKRRKWEDRKYNTIVKKKNDTKKSNLGLHAMQKT